MMELLNKKEETLARVEEIFLSKFKDTQAVFRASYAIANMLNYNVLINVCSSSPRCRGYLPYFCLSRTTSKKALTAIHSELQSSR